MELVKTERLGDSPASARRPFAIGLRWLLLLLFCLTGLTGAPAARNPNSAAPVRREVILSISRVSLDGNGRLVVSMDAAGDLPGAMTFIIDRNANNTIRGGQWALVVAHAEYSGELEEDGDAPNMTLVNQGTLWGSIIGGVVLVDAGGDVVGLDGVQLNLESGSLEFGGVTGSGAAQATDLQSHSNRDRKSFADLLDA